MSDPLPHDLPAGGPEEAPPAEAQIVLDEEDRIVRVGKDDVAKRFAAFVGHVLWERLPGAEPLLGPGFDQARTTGRPVTFTTFYAGRVRTYHVVPAGNHLAVTAERGLRVDATTLATLARSLRAIEAELGARAHAPPGRPAPESRQALP